jgi:four helix bundle protein
MDKNIKTFKNLNVWQKGIELVKELYKITKSFPKEEQYGLSSQIRRAAVSVPSNIAEGFRRRYAKEYKQFLNIALGSCAELETHIIIAKELKYIDNYTEQSLAELLDHICGMLVNLDKKIR